MEEAFRLLVDEYSRMAESYDAHVVPYFAPLARRLIEIGELGPGQRVLDLGCGTGNAAFLAARRVGSKGQVVGIDLAEGMVQLTKAKAAREGVRNATFVRMDCRRIDYPNASFDAVVSCLGVPSVGHERVFAEALRVLRPRGRFAFCEWSKGLSARATAGRVFRETLEKCRPPVPPDDVRRLLEARQCINASGLPLELQSPETVLRKLSEAGFTAVGFSTESHGDVFLTTQAFLNHMVAWGDNEREVGAMNPATRESFRRELVARLAPLMTEQGLAVPHEVYYFWARK